ncbi:MAG TPA: CHAT domain-containing protein, partial [Blastocatellia bacterium]|nr:CHAT domain-containing protein [Blastocatellia bacterium]
MQTYTIKVSPKTAQVTLLRFVSPDGQMIGERELNHAEVEQFVTEVEAAYKINEPNLPALGRRLFEWLDGAEHRWLASALEQTAGLTLRIDVDGRLRHLPWELLFANGAYLCFNAVRPFTPARLVEDKPRELQTHNRPLRLLFMACSAEDVQPLLEFEGEESLILDAARQHQIEMFVEESGSLGGLQYQTTAFGEGHFDVFHLSGHADVRDNEPIFLMENDQGFRQEVTATEIADAFKGNWPRLVFLSGCKTSQATEQGQLPSLCEALVRAGAPAVLGWALPVGDVAASRAAAELYEHLASGKTLDEAVARARLQLLKDGSPFWHLLRLYVNAKPFAPLVTALKTPKRARLHTRFAENDFLDAGSKVEVCKRKDFIGRRRVIQRCLRAVQSRQGEDVYAEGVLLHGMGGLGKSSLAARLCERLQPQGYKRIVFVGALQHEDWDFLSRIKDKLASVEVNQLLDEPLPLHQRLRKLFDGPLAAESFLFVFDDFEQNMEPSGDRQVIKAAPLRILTALLHAIHESASDSRAIVTCRYEFDLPAPLELRKENPGSLRGAELKKKLSRLAAWQVYWVDEQAKEANKRRAEELSAGNPRLLEWLNRVLLDSALDQDAILTAMEQQVDKFREDTLLGELLQQLSPECRRVIALAAVYALPFDRQAIAIAADAPLDPHLQRAVALGLVEEGINPATGEARYFVSRVLLPLIEPELTSDERTEAVRRAVHHLYQTLWQSDYPIGLEESLEIFRLAMAAQEREIAAVIAKAVAARWVNGARYREAELLCETALSLGEDYRLLHTLGRAQVVLGKTAEARRNYDRALALCPEADANERSGILFNLASLVAQQGDVKRALDLWQQSLQL